MEASPKYYAEGRKGSRHESMPWMIPLTRRSRKCKLICSDRSRLVPQGEGGKGHKVTFRGGRQVLGLVVVMSRVHAFGKTDQSVNRLSFRYINDTSITLKIKMYVKVFPF